MLGILFAASAYAAPALTLAGEAAVGVPFAVRFTEDLPGSVMIAGCGPVELERRAGDAWVPVAGSTCDRPVPGLQVDEALAVPVTVATAGTWRAVITWGAGCRPGQPLALAACRTLDVVRSEPFELR